MGETLILTVLVISGPLLSCIDKSLELYADVMNREFSKRWGAHKCDKPGCANVLIFDAGVKVYYNFSAYILYYLLL